MSSNKPKTGGLAALLRLEKERLAREEADHEDASAVSPDSGRPQMENIDRPQISERGRPNSFSSDRPQINLVDGHNNNIAAVQETEKDAVHRTEVDGMPSTFASDVDGKPSKTNIVSRPQSRGTTGHKKDRHRGNFGRYDNRIDGDLLKRIKKFCIDHQITQQDFAERSAVHFMENVAVHKREVVDGLPSLDDLMMLFKTDEDIIRLYQYYNPGNKWTTRDDEVAHKYNKTDRRIIEYSIVQTKFNARLKKINSFKYYEEEIRDCIDKHLSSETLDAMVGSARRAWAKAHASSSRDSGSISDKVN